MPNTETPDEGELLTISELADKLKVSVRTIRTMIKDEQIPYLKVRGSYRFLLSDVQAAL
tara:strand:- start:374 stop:550 length:177 start_codon:yes stop_codon:yes gene_type:complete